MRSTRLILALLAVALLGAAAAAQQRDLSQVEIKTTKVADGIYMMEGAGGNLGVFAGADGVLLIDDQFAPLSDKIKAAIAKVSDKPVRFLLNTHYHGDHVGGNENFGKDGVTIVAQDNVWERMSVEQVNKLANRTTPPYPKAALPIVTFGQTLTFHLNGEAISATHVAPAHTDGDVFVRFPKANVIHAGDCFFNGTYPVIDVSAGGNIDGIIAADEQMLMASDANTKIIPGHGPLGDAISLAAFHDMLIHARDKIRPMVVAGKSVEQIVAAKPTAELDEKWGKGSMTPDRFVTAVAQGMRAK